MAKTIYGSVELKALMDEYDQIHQNYNQKMDDAFSQYLVELHLDKDVVDIASGKIGRLKHFKRSYSFISREYKFFPYTKNNVLSQVPRDHFFDNTTLTDRFRPAEGEEIVSAD